MRIALLGAGRIGQLHGRLVAEQPGVDEVIVYDVDAENAAAAARAVNGRVAATAEEAIAAADAVIVAASTPMHAPLVALCDRRRQAGLRREATRVRPRGDRRPRGEGRSRRRRGPGGLPAPLRSRLRRGQAPPRQRRAGHPVHGPAHRPRPHAPARRLHPGLRRPVPRLVDPRLRRAALADRLRGRRGLRDRRGPQLPDLRGARRRRHRRRHPAPARTARHRRRTAQTRHDPLRLRRAHGGHRIEGRRVRRSRRRTPIRSLEAGAPTSRRTRPGTRSSTRFETAYRIELLAFLRVARGEIPSPCTARDALEAMRIAYMATKSRLEHRPVRLDEVP